MIGAIAAPKGEEVNTLAQLLPPMAPFPANTEPHHVSDEEPAADEDDNDDEAGTGLESTIAAMSVAKAAPARPTAGAAAKSRPAKAQPTSAQLKRTRRRCRRLAQAGSR